MSYGLANFGQGFLQGANLARDHRRQDEHDTLRRQQMEEERAFRERQFGLQQERAGMAREQHEAWRAEHAREQGRRATFEGAAEQARGPEGDWNENAYRRNLMQGISDPGERAQLGQMWRKADEEGLAEALRLMLAGDERGALSAYNRTGRERLEYMRRNEDGSIAFKEVDGEPVSVSLEQMYLMAGQQPPERKTHSLGPGHGLFDDRGERIAYNPHYNAGRGGSGEGGEGGGYKTADFNAIRGMARDLFARLDPNGQFFLPEGTQQKVVDTTQMAEQLIRSHGVPHAEAVRLAFYAVEGPLDDAAARGQAEKEAVQQSVPRRERKEWIAERAKALQEESRWAQREIEKLRGRPQGEAAPQGATAPQRPPSAMPVERAVERMLELHRNGQMNEDHARRFHAYYGDEGVALLEKAQGGGTAPEAGEENPNGTRAKIRKALEAGADPEDIARTLRTQEDVDYLRSLVRGGGAAPADVPARPAGLPVLPPEAPPAGGGLARAAGETVRGLGGYVADEGSRMARLSGGVMDAYVRRPLAAYNRFMNDAEQDFMGGLYGLNDPARRPVQGFASAIREGRAPTETELAEAARYRRLLSEEEQRHLDHWIHKAGGQR